MEWKRWPGWACSAAGSRRKDLGSGIVRSLLNFDSGRARFGQGRAGDAVDALRMLVQSVCGRPTGKDARNDQQGGAQSSRIRPGCAPPVGGMAIEGPFASHGREDEPATRGKKVGAAKSCGNLIYCS
jgi:hypothetical protein